jgi:hypothetical protein
MNDEASCRSLYIQLLYGTGRAQAAHLPTRLTFVTVKPYSTHEIAENHIK